MTNPSQHHKEKWDSAIVYRIRTHLVTERDDIAEVVGKYAKSVAEPGDIVGVAESVVAITQGRAIAPETVEPSWLARFVARFAHPDASISAPGQCSRHNGRCTRILLAAAAG